MFTFVILCYFMFFNSMLFFALLSFTGQNFVKLYHSFLLFRSFEYEYNFLTLNVYLDFMIYFCNHWHLIDTIST